MEYRNLAIVAAALVCTGCQPSVELPQGPAAASTSPNNEGEATAADDTPKAVAQGAVEATSEEPSVVGIDDFEKGKRLRESKYQTSRALAVRFTAEQKLILMNKDRALQLYQAEHGEYPASHEEFMEKIIKPNQIQLPELEPGYEYLYKSEDPMNLYKVSVDESDE